MTSDRRTGRRIWAVLLTTVLAVLLVGCSSSPTSSGTTAKSGASGALNVVAGENFWGNITAQIGGDRVAVTSIISDPSADPHLYASSAQNAGAIAQADVVIVNGAGYDDFMTKLLGASPNPNRVVVTVQQVLGATGSDVNPHFWYDLPKVPQVAKAIEQALAGKDPSHATDYAANLATFDASLKQITDVIATVNEKYPGAPVAYTERVPGYLLKAAGLTVKTPPGFATAVEQGNDPSPSDTATMDALMSGKQVRLLLYNAQATSPTTQKVRDQATRAGIPVIGVTETLPPEYPTYQAWQLAQVKAILQALGG